MSDLITLQEAAVILRCTDKTVRRRIADGTLKAVRRKGGGPRGQILVHRSEVDDMYRPIPNAKA